VRKILELELLECALRIETQSDWVLYIPHLFSPFSMRRSFSGAVVSLREVQCPYSRRICRRAHVQERCLGEKRSKKSIQHEDSEVCQAEPVVVIS
jgi:hypothetical protein